jgi:hypothetical protein
MEHAIATEQLIVRQRTPEERAEIDARRAARAQARDAGRAKRRGPRRHPA